MEKKIIINKAWLIILLIACTGLVISIGYYLAVQLTQKSANNCINGVKPGSLVILTSGSVGKDRLNFIAASVWGRLGNSDDDLAIYEILVPEGKETAAQEVLEQFPEVSSVVRNTCIEPST